MNRGKAGEQAGGDDEQVCFAIFFNLTRPRLGIDSAESAESARDLTDSTELTRVLAESIDSELVP